MNDQISFIPVGGIGDVTKNMYLYEYKRQVLIIDCGLGFADETMLGVDLLLPDISYLLQAKREIVGMVLTHGHEDHIGALPFIVPQLPPFPIFGSPFTAALANEKLREFGIGTRVQSVPFEKGSIHLGPFDASFIRVTHSIPDTSHIFLRTPVGNFYHGSDFKLDDNPYDGHITDYDKIKKLSQEGVLCLLSDCLGTERQGRVASEIMITESFMRALQSCEGKFIVTTYSSNVSRLNQIIEASESMGRHVCFVGRSLLKVKDVAKQLKYLKMKDGTEVKLDEIGNYQDNKVTFIVAGSQGQESSALARIANREHREIRLAEHDLIIFSADPIPGNEATVYELIDTITKMGVRVLYSSLSREFHVSGHGAIDELKQLVDLVKPKQLLPIGGNYRHMFGYRQLGIEVGYNKNDVLLLEDGQEVLFGKTETTLGRTIPVKHVYVDEISGEEIESFVLRDRQKLSEGGIVIILAEVDANNGQLVERPDIIIRGFASKEEVRKVSAKLFKEIKNTLLQRKGRVTDWIYLRKHIGEIAEKRIFRDLRRRPLVLPIVIEV